MKIRLLPLTILSGVLWCSTPAGWGQTPPVAGNRNALAIEALGRLKGMDLEANPALKAKVLKVLESTRGTPDFVRIVQDFNLAGQNAGLLELALAHPREETGIEALRLILASHDVAVVTAALGNTNTAVRMAEALGNTGEKEVVPMLLPLVEDGHQDLAARKQAVRSLAQIQSGATELLSLAAADKLPTELKFTATTELNQVRWPELKAKAGEVLPLPQGRNTEALPPVTELLKRTGDPGQGSKVFERPDVGCNNCHRVNDRGTDLGPALSEIGTKLGKDALYEAILEPSSGIAFGFEAWTLELNSGDEAYGLIVSETADELTLKNVKGIPSRIKKSDIAKRQQMKLSLMPAGLQQAMSTQDLVDLVEYLATLKKPAK